MLHNNFIEFQCKKGGGHDSENTNYYLPHKENQDSFFIAVDSEIKIFGVFDGHGEFGHLVSGFAKGIMLDYIRYKEKYLRPKYLNDKGNHHSIFTIHLDNAYDIQIRKALRRCFKYT